MARSRKPAPGDERSARSAEKAPSPLGPDGKPLPFEKALERLEGIVGELEAGKLPLEESLNRFEEGVKLTRFLESELDRAEKRVEELVETPGGPATRPWEGDRFEEEEPRDASQEEDDEADDAKA